MGLNKKLAKSFAVKKNKKGLRDVRN